MVLAKKWILPLSILISLSLVGGCGSMKKKDKPAAAGNEVSLEGQNEGMNLEVNADSDSGKAGALKTVYFDFNSASLRSDTKSTLEANAAFLKANATAEVQVEGHCDERGSVQYNLALGERRAKAVRDYLVAKGVEGRRISIISFGKERPISFGHDETSWGQNRRGNFVVTAK